MLTESEAWRIIGEAYEARAAHQDLDVSRMTDLAGDGLCTAVALLHRRDAFASEDSFLSMDLKLQQAVMDDSGEDFVRFTYLQPWITAPGGSELRATLAYLFAEEAANAN